MRGYVAGDVGNDLDFEVRFFYVVYGEECGHAFVPVDAIHEYGSYFCIWCKGGFVLLRVCVVVCCVELGFAFFMKHVFGF